MTPPALRALLARLAARGVTFLRDPSGQVTVRGWSRLRPAERALLRQHRAAVSELLAVEPEAPRPHLALPATTGGAGLAADRHGSPLPGSSPRPESAPLPSPDDPSAADLVPELYPSTTESPSLQDLLADAASERQQLREYSAQDLHRIRRDRRAFGEFLSSLSDRDEVSLVRRLFVPQEVE